MFAITAVALMARTLLDRSAGDARTVTRFLLMFWLVYYSLVFAAAPYDAYKSYSTFQPAVEEVHATPAPRVYPLTIVSADFILGIFLSRIDHFEFSAAWSLPRSISFVSVVAMPPSSFRVSQAPNAPKIWAQWFSRSSKSRGQPRPKTRDSLQSGTARPKTSGVR